MVPKTVDEVIATSNRIADEVGIPRLLLLACGIAEANLRWNARRPVNPADEPRYWPDCSAGVWQQTVRWSAEYLRWCAVDAAGHDPAQYPGQDVTAAVAEHYFDVEHAARVAAAQLKAKYKPAEPDAIAKALARYNRPALDGAFASPGHEANYRRGIAEAQAILGEQPAPAPTPGGIVYEDYRDPAPAGRFSSMPKGIILHGSRSGIAGNPKQAEYLATARYEQNNPAGLGWHATIGEGKVAVHLDPREWGWHARAASTSYLGVELAQATADEPITDDQVDALADWIKTRVLPVWPALPLHFPSHAEVERSGETGQRDGKTDPFAAGDPRMDELRGRLLARFQGDQPAPSPYADQVGSGILEMMAADGTEPAMPSTFLPLGADPAIAEQCIGMNGRIYLWHLPTGRRWTYDPSTQQGA